MTTEAAPLAEYIPNRRMKPRTFTISEPDFNAVKWMSGHLDCSNSEVVRTAIRAYAAHLAYLEQRANTS